VATNTIATEATEKASKILTVKADVCCVFGVEAAKDEHRQEAELGRGVQHRRGHDG
jgi:hypothetical protein